MQKRRMHGCDLVFDDYQGFVRESLGYLLQGGFHDQVLGRQHMEFEFLGYTGQWLTLMVTMITKVKAKPRDLNGFSHRPSP